MKYHQITLEERYRISALRQAGHCQAEMARRIRRHRSTISRELARNRSRWDGGYRPSKAQERPNGRRSQSRRNERFGRGGWQRVERLVRQQWSPEQISGALRKSGELSISHETLYRHIWMDRWQGGSLFRDLRQAMKKRRKRYGAYDSRGRLAGKRHISDRPKVVERRTQSCHWEIDTVMGVGTDFSEESAASRIGRCSVHVLPHSYSGEGTYRNQDRKHGNHYRLARSQDDAPSA